jgi:glucose/arabinose dehydrogenase
MKFKSSTRAMYYSFGGVVMLMASTGTAQNVFVSCVGSDSIVEITPSGAQITFASGLNHPVGLAFDSAGNLFEADEGSGNIYEFINNYGVLSSRPTLFASGLNFPFGLAFNSAGNLFESDYNSGNINEFTPTETESTFASGLNGPEGLAFSGANLFVANQRSGIITEISSSGIQSTFHSGLSSPSGLAFRGGILLFVANQQSDNIDEITSLGGARTIASGLADPNGLAFDGTGDLFEADYGSGQINEFTFSPILLGLGPKPAPGSSESIFASGLDGPVGLAFQPVPEPSALGLLAVGATALLVRRRRC